MIEARELTKSFGPLRALDAVSFQVAAGEIVGLLGPNGSGKTTLLRILTGFFPPDRGCAVVAGAKLEDEPFEVRRRVGYLPEHAPLYPEATVASLLRFAAEVKIPEPGLRSGRIAAVVRECGLTGFEGRRIGALSRGYRQRVGIAQALVGRPQVLVLDEPTAGLDPTQVRELRQLIVSLAGRTTILLSSHVLADVASVCGRVLILHLGRLVLAERIDALRREVRRSGELVFRTRCEMRELEAVLARVPDLRLERMESDDDGTLLAYLVHPQGEGEESSRVLAERVTSELARAAVAAGLPVLEVGQRRQTLEDLLVDLLGEEPSQT
jgi:ABC-2 type transport system ATP-binding protein